MSIATLVKSSAYHDSVALLALARALRSRPGVKEAAALMGTPANRDLLTQAGLLTAEAGTAGPNDLVVVVRAESAALAGSALAAAEALLAQSGQRMESAGGSFPRTLGGARRRRPEANLALISVPGPFAAAEARKALRAGLHVMLFSDNVSVPDEVQLKRLASGQGLLLMGPDCGTAYIAGIPLGFANAVPRGRIGIVAASGTGLQQVAALLAQRGRGLSHAIGVGGRDMSAEVGGLMTLAALDALGGDPGTEAIAVIGKPAAPAVRARVMAALRAIGKPAVVALLGRDAAVGSEAGITSVTTLEDAARAAEAALEGRPWHQQLVTVPEFRRRVLESRAALRPGQSSVHGLYTGGTLAHESLLLLGSLLGEVASNLAAGGGRHRVLDLGGDEFTMGRAHPMLDPTSRLEAVRQAAERPDVAVLLLDVVLGHGAAADPAGDIAPALESARAAARARGRGLAVVASVVGTDADPQGFRGQVARLEAAGAWVLPSNAQAARAAACIAGGESVMHTLLGAAAP